MEVKEISSLSDKDLLALRFCDLPVTLEGTLVQQRAWRVFTQLADRGIRVSPSTWLSEKWFNPDGVVGFAIPFYLAHPRLVRLERRLMLEAEGAGERECLRILLYRAQVLAFRVRSNSTSALNSTRSVDVFIARTYEPRERWELARVRSPAASGR